jgi:two-component system nitrate/nitrite sensor histidine kinase NarX
MSKHGHWTLGAKMLIVGAPFLLIGLAFMAVTLWVSWQLDGGAAAVNEAGRMRMQTYRMSLAIGTAQRAELPRLVEEFEASVSLLRDGDPQRPLFMPWDVDIESRFVRVQLQWQQFRERWIDAQPTSTEALPEVSADFVASIDAMVAAIESHLSRWTALLHLLQAAMMILTVLTFAALLFAGYLFVLEPVGLLKRAIQRLQDGDLGARVDQVTSDEFGTLAEGFNSMAERLQSMYRNLEGKVAEKTLELEEKRERLQNLYEVTALVAHATSLEELADKFVRGVRRIARADGIALRWSDQGNERYLMLATEGLPAAMVEAEQCVSTGACHCGAGSAQWGPQVIPLHAILPPETARHCERAGFHTVVTVPIRLHERVMGEVDLFYHAQTTLKEAERSLHEVLASHLASAMENLRLNAMAREAAVSHERNLLARELHDSIAQSLAFLKIQVKLMHDAVAAGDQARIESVLAEIDTGVRESYSDVRELLVHFRTRTNAEDIRAALESTLQKFELQSGLKAKLTMEGHGLPLSPEVQIQVLHIVQEALSNVRKHARASRVWLDVAQQPQWRFEVRDDGEGFDAEAGAPDDTHVGLKIMAERAQRIGADVEVTSSEGRGTSVVLTLPAATTREEVPLPLSQAQAV